MTQIRYTPFAFTLALLALLCTPAAARTILVTTGEHEDFTRVVLQSARPIDWELQPQTPGSTERRLSITAPDRRIDLSRAFRRIPRLRLADLVRTPEGLGLRLNCDCPIEAWTERSGLVVLDIGNPRQSPRPAPVLPPRAAAPALPFSQDELARTAGTALARTWPPETMRSDLPGPAARQGPPPSPISDTETQAIMHRLTADVASALTQGILDPAPDRTMQTDMIRLSDEDTISAIPPSLRVMTVLQRPDDHAARLPDDQPGPCAAAAALDFATASAARNFNDALASGLSRWVGEFDQPEPDTTRDLVVLYLQHGFGAEARALIEHASHPVPGRDLLLGFADTLEGRHSNSRLRLAEQHGCGGAAAMLAALAGAPPRALKARGGDIASTFAQSPGVMRAGLGGALIGALVEADAVDAARMVADTLRRTPLARPGDLQRADALLDRARGEALQAGARLTFHASEEVDSVQLRLQIALETGATVPPSVLLDAEALAGSHRATPEGSDLLATLIRLQIAAGAPDKAMDLHDRLSSWGNGTPQARSVADDLHDMVWSALALQAADPDLLALVLNRNDWRIPSFSADTRAALAERLLGFGLTEAAESLLPFPGSARERHLLARIHLEQADPDLALALLTEDQSPEARLLRANALQARGEHRAASALFAEVGAFDAAARNALLAGDWAMLETAGAAGGSATQVELARALTLLPDLASPAYAAPGTERLVNAPRTGTSVAQPAPIAAPQAATLPPSPVAARATPAPSLPPETLPAEEPVPDSEPETEPPAFGATIPRLPSALPSALPNAMARSTALLSESEALRAAFAPLLTDHHQD
ncbi:MAG TPA: hypothetical protein GX700_12905 [Paracoccus sp.]|nr:hypothetical protein [Paracoccus sp. (in: a-proteobacteria)]